MLTDLSRLERRRARTSRRWRTRTAAALTCAVLGLALAPAARADVITDWNATTIQVGGPMIQRTLAMVHIAMFDAANAAAPQYAPYLPSLPNPSDTSPEAAAAAAAHGVLIRLFPGQAAVLDAALATSLAGIADGPAKATGLWLGDLVAAAIYEARLGDNILAPGPLFVPGSAPGDYQLTTPGPPQPVNTNAPNWMPFALLSASQFRPNGPPALTSLRYARDLAEVQALGGAISSIRTPALEEIGRWHTEQAQFQFNRIARAETALDGRSLLEHARLFALLNIALADAVTSVFDAKYTFRFWRPVTAIRQADTDGNARTEADAGWTPFLTTPPHPEYPAAHAVVQGAAARVMNSYFGPHHWFATTAPAVPGVVRTYDSFDAFAAEGAFARIVGGMHFRASLEEGARQGKKVGNWVLEHCLRPLE